MWDVHPERALCWRESKRLARKRAEGQDGRAIGKREERGAKDGQIKASQVNQKQPSEVGGKAPAARERGECRVPSCTNTATFRSSSANFVRDGEKALEKRD
ncbi:unnamed protein product, partial [Choristocarpus tenellus]